MSSFRSSDVAGVACADHRSARKREALELFSGLPRRYDELSAALSFWQDPRWRRALVDEIAPAAGERVLDVATGTGLVAAELLSRAPCTVVGVDQSAQMLSAARERFAQHDSERVRLIEGEAEALPFPDASFDALSFTYLLRYVEDPRATIARARARAAAGGPHRLAGVRRTAVAAGPSRLAALHGGRAAVAGRSLLARVARGRTLPRSEHPRLLRASSPGADRRLLAVGGTRGRAGCAA